MPTPHKHADLIHAFADGKVLQCLNQAEVKWKDWTYKHCPRFEEGDVFRIKPEEPKKVKLECWLHRNTGALMYRYEGNDQTEYYVRLPELDREITLPVEESC